MKHLKTFLIEAAAFVFAAHPIAAETVYQQVMREAVVDQPTECAAAIMALNGNTELAALVSTDFLRGAANYLHTMGGWDDRNAAFESVMLRASVAAEEFRLRFPIDGERDAVVNIQSECVLGLLH